MQARDVWVPILNHLAQFPITWALFESTKFLPAPWTGLEKYKKKHRLRTRTLTKDELSSIHE